MHAASHSSTSRSWSLGSAIACASKAAVVTVVSIGPAQAFDIDGTSDLITETVASRKPENKEPEGRRVGNFFVTPLIGERLVYDDNIFSAPEGTLSDFRLESTPSLHIESRLPRHAIDLSLAGKIVNYYENTDQNYENYLARARGALHFDHAHTLSAVVLTSLDHEEVGSTTASISAAEPVPVHKNRISVGLTRDVGQLYGTVAATAESREYDSVRATDGSRLNQDLRNQEIYRGEFRAGYRFSPGYELVTKFEAVRQDNEPDALGERNATGYGAIVGLAFESSQVLSWRLLGGYGVRHFNREDTPSVGSYLLEGRVEWLPTDRLKLFGTVRQEIQDDIGADDGGRINSSVIGRMEYEIRHDLALKVGAELTETDFISSDRVDVSSQVNATLEYDLSREWLLSLGYQFHHRDSNEDEFDSTRNRFSIGAKYRF